MASNYTLAKAVRSRIAVCVAVLLMASKMAGADTSVATETNPASIDDSTTALELAGCRTEHLQIVEALGECRNKTDMLSTSATGLHQQFEEKEAHLKKASDELARYKEECDTLSETLASTRVDAKKCADSVTSSQQSLGERDGRIETLNEEIAGQRAENTQLAEELHAAQIQASDDSKTISALKQSIGQKDEHIQTVASELTGCKADKASQAGDLEKALDDTKNQAQTIAALQKSLEEKDSRIETTAGQLEDCRVTSGKLSATLDETMSALASNKTALTKESSQRTAFAREAENLRSELSVLSTRLQDLTRERDELRQQLTKTEAEKNLVHERLSAIHSGTAGKSEMDSAKERAGALGAEFFDRYQQRRKGPQAREALSQTQENLRYQQRLIAALSGARGIHEVQKSETLSEIAMTHYQAISHWRAIYQANDYLLDNPDRLLPGMVLVMP